MKREIKVHSPFFMTTSRGSKIMMCILAEDDSERGWEQGKLIRTSRVLSHDAEAKRVETMNTVYVIVEPKED